MAPSNTKLPRFIVVQVEELDCVKYVNQSEVAWEKEGSSFDIFAKIAVEPAKNSDDYFHLRFCHTNKYWARGQGADNTLLVANSNNPEEDKTKPSCTLFQLSYNVEPYYHFKHVQSGGFVKPTQSGSPLRVVDDEESVPYPFTTVDWDTLVKMPKHVAFKGDNRSYLTAVWSLGHPYLQFSSSDANQKESGHEVSLLPDGFLRIKSDYFGRFWRRSDWIYGDVVDDGSLSNLDTHFWPVRVDNKTIALRARINNNFCKRHNAEGKTSCLNAAVSVGF